VIRRNFAVLSAAQTAGRLLAFAVTVHLTRTLMTEGFGSVAFATSVLAGASAKACRDSGGAQVMARTGSPASSANRLPTSAANSAAAAARVSKFATATETT